MAESSALLMEKFEQHADFVKVLFDAFILVDENGHVVKANQQFAMLTGKKMRQIQKVDCADSLISFSVNGEPLNMAKIIAHEQATRIDEVSATVEGSSEAKNLILGIYPFYSDDKSQKLGAFIIMRDVTAETNLQGQYKDKAIASITDPLTTLFTRAYFDEYLPSQVSQMERMDENERGPITLVMCDIDFFKKVNDQYGHQAGDHVLRVVAKIMKQTFRKSDICCRYGGEEFLVILPGAGAEDSAMAANKMRRLVEAEHIEFEGTHIPVTISCGVSTIKISQENYDATMARADEALYEAKRNGRNLVCINEGDGIQQTARD